jgi:hypothetical protein
MLTSWQASKHAFQTACHMAYKKHLAREHDAGYGRSCFKQFEAAEHWLSARQPGEKNSGLFEREPSEIFASRA